eukprot:271055_1
MARTSYKMTLQDLPSIHESVGLPLDLIKAKPNLLTSLLSPSDGYMQTIRDVYKHKTALPENKAAKYALDPLTLIIDLNGTLIYKFKWTDMLQIGQEIEYDQQKATITEVHYIINTQSKSTPKSPVQIEDDDNTSNNNDHDAEDQYLAHITKFNQRIPRCGSFINGERITDVSVYQINVEIVHSFMGGHIKTMTLESIGANTDITDSEMETPQPTPSIVINIKDDTDKLNKISLTELFEEYKDEILKIGDDYVAIRPNVDKFLYLCSQIFTNVTLFTTCKDTEMAHVMNGVHRYLASKLSKVNKSYNHQKQPLWNGIVYDTLNGVDVKRNLSQVGADLSRVFIIDSDDMMRYEGLEPNRVKIRRYKVNLNDTQLMDTAWPVLFECHTYNDIRYGLLYKQQHQNTVPIATESESLSATMRYLVVLQYTYFKSCQMLDHSNEYEIAARNTYSSVLYQDTKSVYSTDTEDDADDEYQTSDESDDEEEESDTEESESEEDTTDDEEEEKTRRRRVMQNELGCVSMFGGVFNDFIAKCAVSR